MFIRKKWYVAAWGSEVGQGMLGRRILNEPVLIHRLENGEAVAIGDRCPHRFAPLHIGRKLGDNVQCGYHGLSFGPDGSCVGNPRSGGQVPPGTQVKSYPLVERKGLLWIWMGDPAEATVETIPPLEFLIEGDERYGPGYLHVRADYRLVIDNLMDLGHAAFLHEETLFRLTPAMNDGTLSVRRDGETITAGIAMPGIDLPGVPGRVDQWLDMHWTAPAILVLDLGHVAEGAVRPNHGRLGLHAITPETDQTSHYFFSGTANLASLKRNPFTEEDEPMLAACQEMMAGAEFWSLKPAVLPTDAGAIMVRRQLDKLLREEASV
jgi:nitrite reductase/ring-hydroxylating ferredoxin subunit